MLGVLGLLLISVGGKVFVVAPFWIFMVLGSSFILLMLEKEIRPCFVPLWLGGVWNGFLLSRVRGQAVPCRFCGVPDNDGHYFGNVPFLLALWPYTPGLLVNWVSFLGTLHWPIGDLDL